MSPQARDHSFDELARGLADGSVTRGKAIRLMGAALVGGALASVGMREASADPPGCKRNGKTCRRNVQCCSGNCEGGICAAALPTCPPGTVELSNGTCVTSCAGGGTCPGCEGCAQGISDTYCFNLSGSQGSCATDSDCPTGEFCASGASGSCQTACTPTQT